MAIEVKLPQISEDAESGQVSEILVSVGDHIDKEQSVIVVESDKAAVEVPSEEEGKVKEIKVKANQEIKVGDTILVLEENGGAEEKKEKDGEEQKEGKPDEKAGEKDTEETKEAEVEDKTDAEVEEDQGTEKEPKEESKEARSKSDDDEENEDQTAAKTEEDAEGPKSSKEKAKEPSDQAVPAAPLARKLARELGIDLNDVPADDSGRITQESLMDYAKGVISSVSAKPAKVTGGIKLPDFSKWGETESTPLSSIRKTTAENTTKSWQHIPHVTQFDKADVTELEKFIEKQKEKSEAPITITAVLTKIIGEALMQFPQFNTSLDLDNQTVIHKKYYSVGIAVDTKEGLLVPVVRNVEDKSIQEIAEEIVDLAGKARNKKLSPQAMKGGNFTISNLGGIGGTSFTPVIFPPQVAILGVSRSAKELVLENNEFVPRTMLPLSLSYDHRAIDGADAARFLRWVCEVLEQPMKLMMD